MAVVRSGAAHDRMEPDAEQRPSSAGGGDPLVSHDRSRRRHHDAGGGRFAAAAGPAAPSRPRSRGCRCSTSARGTGSFPSSASAGAHRASWPPTHYSWHGAGWGTKAGFTLAREALGSRVEDIDIDVMDLSPERVGTFDVVLFLGVLYHLRHPFLALERVASVTRRPPDPRNRRRYGRDSAARRWRSIRTAS